MVDELESPEASSEVIFTVLKMIFKLFFPSTLQQKYRICHLSAHSDFIQEGIGFKTLKICKILGTQDCFTPFVQHLILVWTTIIQTGTDLSEGTFFTDFS